jgi:hypothetical protein
MRNQVSHPYKTTDDITVLYILFFKYLERKQEDKKILKSMMAGIPQI